MKVERHTSQHAFTCEAGLAGAHRAVGCAVSTNLDCTAATIGARVRTADAAAVVAITVGGAGVTRGAWRAGTHGAFGGRGALVVCVGAGRAVAPVHLVARRTHPTRHTLAVHFTLLHSRREGWLRARSTSNTAGARAALHTSTAVTPCGPSRARPLSRAANTGASGV